MESKLSGYKYNPTAELQRRAFPGEQAGLWAELKSGAWKVCFCLLFQGCKGSKERNNPSTAVNRSVCLEVVRSTGRCQRLCSSQPDLQA